MLTTTSQYDPEADVSVDVGIASDQYLRWYNSPPVTAARAAAQKETEAQLGRTREVAILAGCFLALFALERIVGKKIQAKGAASGAAVTTAAKALAGGA